jgi:hypothetical protein
MGDEPCRNVVHEPSVDDESVVDDCGSPAATSGIVDDPINPAKCLSVVSAPLSTSMAERERRNVSRNERVCSYVLQSKNHVRQQDVTEPVRNRQRDKSDGVCCAARNRSGMTVRTGNSSQSTEALADVEGSEASANAVDNSEEEPVVDAADMGIEPLPAMTAPIRNTEFFGLSPEAIYTAVSTHNWQVRFTDFFVYFIICVLCEVRVYR